MSCAFSSDAPASPDSTEAHPKRRLVVVVGRPNVGKSALFNRITGRRIAIVHDESGVTRDRIVRQVNWEPAPFEIVDTGGVWAASSERVQDTIAAGVIDQVETSLAEAAAAILVVDAQTGLHPLDAEVAVRVRRAGIPCCLAVNKCDLEQHEAAAAEFAGLGFPLYPVSALHNRGMDALLAAVTAHLPETPLPVLDRPLKVAIVGRPNAGKSSFINRLMRQQRVIVAEVAGTTRDSIEIPFTIGGGAEARHYTLIDTAGMRHVHRIDNSVERFSLFRAERSVQECDVAVLILDASAGPTVQDKHIAALIQKARKGCVIVVNKWDVAMDQGMTQARYEPALRKATPFLNYCPVVFLSAKSGFNIRQSVEAIDQVATEIQRTLPTGLLNRAIADATARAQIPSAGRRQLRIFYATQTGTAPIEVRLFVNDVALATSHYTDYLVRSLRERFGLAGAPITIRYRGRPRPEGADSRRPATPGVRRVPGAAPRPGRRADAPRKHRRT